MEQQQRSERRRRRALGTGSALGTVERDFLPPQFAAQLARRVLHVSPTTPLTKADSSSTTTSSDNDDDDNNNTTPPPPRRERLEAFAEGWANCCGRRGSRAALGTLFQLCADADNVLLRNSKDLVDGRGREVRAPVAQVLQLALQLARATAAVLRGDAPLPPRSSSDNNPAAASSMDLSSMTASCLEFVRQQRLRRSVAPTTAMSATVRTAMEQEDMDLDRGWCSKMDFIEWVEAAVPLLARVLPAFLNVVLFPEQQQQSQQQQQPPSSSLHNMSSSSSAFAFPRLLEESAIWTDDDDLVPALFALGCLSKSLGGEVRVCARIQNTVVGGELCVQVMERYSFIMRLFILIMQRFFCHGTHFTYE